MCCSTRCSTARIPEGSSSIALAVFASRRYCTCVYTEVAMPLNIRSEAVNQLAERLATRKHTSKTEAVRIALENELQRLDKAIPLRERLRALQDRVLLRPATGLDRSE